MSTEQETGTKVSTRADVFVSHSAARRHYNSQKSGIDAIFHRLNSEDSAPGTKEIEMNSLVRAIKTLRTNEHYGLAGETFLRVLEYCDETKHPLPEALTDLAAEWKKAQERGKTGLGWIQARLRYAFFRAGRRLSTILGPAENEPENYL